MARRIVIPVTAVLKLYARRFSNQDRGKTRTDKCPELEARYGIGKGDLIDRIYAGSYSITLKKDRK
jgi:hypothetical protein